MWMFGVLAAFAAEPAVEVRTDGTVVATLTVAASESEVRAALLDGAGSARLSPEVLSVQSTRKGSCEELTKETRGLFRPFRLRSLRCPTADGWRETLVSSEDFTAFEADWIVEPAEGGTKVTYQVRTDLAVDVPESMLRRSLARAAATVLGNLATRVR